MTQNAQHKPPQTSTGIQATRQEKSVRVVSVTENFNQEPGNAIITIEGVPDINDGSPLQVAFKKPGSQDEFLGTSGWQPGECRFGVTLTGNDTGDRFKFALSPDLAFEMESRSYELHLRHGGKAHTAVFHWPEVREPDSPPHFSSNGNHQPANFGDITYGYITESGDITESTDITQTTDIAETTDITQPTDITETTDTNSEAEQSDYNSAAFKPEAYQPPDYDVDDGFSVANTSPGSTAHSEKASNESQTEEAAEVEHEEAGTRQEETGTGQEKPADVTPDKQGESSENISPDQAGAGATTALPPQTGVNRETEKTNKTVWVVFAAIVLILLAIILYLLLADNRQTSSPVSKTPPPPEQQPLPAPPQPTAPQTTEPEPVPEPVPETAPRPVPFDSGITTASDDRFRVKPGQPARLRVMENDSGEQIRVVAIVQKPSRGLVTIEQNTQIMYTWLSDLNGDDSFRYQIQDAQGRTATATVTIMARDPVLPGTTEW